MFSIKKNYISAMYLAFVLAATFIAFCPTLQNKFITNDDPGHLINNNAVRSLSAENLKVIFSQTVNKTYIPLTTLSFAVEYQLFGFDPFYYHLNNLLLHLGVVALAFVLAVRWFGFSPLVAGFTALVFGIHPMHVESVAWVTERKDVLYAIFYLGALERYCAYLHQNRRRDYYLTLFLTLFSILAKPMALSLPLVLWVLDWYFRWPINIRVFLEKIPYLLIVIPISLVTYILNARSVGTTPVETLLTWVWSCVFYPHKFFVPDFFLTVYSLPQPVTLFNLTFAGAVFLFFVGLGLLIYFRKQRLLVFAFLYYFASIFFLLRFDTKTDVNFVADRFMYLPSLGFCFLIALGFQWLIRPEHSVFARRFFAGLIFLAYLFLGVKTFHQTKIWGDGVALWSGVVEHYPDCFYAYDHRGFAYAQKGQFSLAISDYDQALRLKSKYMPAFHNRALAYSQIHEDSKALADFTKALELDPNYANAYFNRAIFYSERGQNDQAVADYSTAIEKTSHQFVAAYSNRGAVYLAQHKVQEALKDFDRALLLDPRDLYARNNRAIAFVQTGDLAAALGDLDQALKFVPKDAETYFNRALVYSRLERFSQALADFKKVLEIQPRHQAALQKALEIQRKIGM